MRVKIARRTTFSIISGALLRSEHCNYFSYFAATSCPSLRYSGAYLAARALSAMQLTVVWHKLCWRAPQSPCDHASYWNPVAVAWLEKALLTGIRGEVPSAGTPEFLYRFTFGRPGLAEETSTTPGPPIKFPKALGWHRELYALRADTHRVRRHLRRLLPMELSAWWEQCLGPPTRAVSARSSINHRCGTVRTGLR